MTRSRGWNDARGCWPGSGRDGRILPTAVPGCAWSFRKCDGGTFLLVCGNLSPRPQGTSTHARWFLFPAGCHPMPCRAAPMP